MRALGLDLGSARVGVALSDELGSIAHPRPNLDGRNEPALLEAVSALVDSEGITVIIVGLPLDLSGAEGRAARRARRVARALADRVSVSVELVDERLTTVEARKRLREAGAKDRDARHRIDGAAAAVLLQAWLESRGRSPS